MMRIIISAVLAAVVIAGIVFVIRQSDEQTSGALSQYRQETPQGLFSQNTLSENQGYSEGSGIDSDAMQEEGAETSSDSAYGSTSASQVAGATRDIIDVVIPPARAAQRRTGTWKLISFDRRKWDIDDEDSDVDEIRYKNDVCKDIRKSTNAHIECRKTSKLKRDSSADLGEKKCSASCTIGSSCALWNSDEKKDGSLSRYIASYACL